MPSRTRSPLLLSRPNRAALVLCAALAGSALAPPAHAFWGLIGKAAGKAATAGKAAGVAGKGAAVGAGAVAAEGATGVAAKGAMALGDDAAHAAQAGSRGFGGAHELSTVNAALPPEVAAYLAKPAKELTPKDTSFMMDNYRQMVERAGKSGDFTAVERMPTSAGTARTLPAEPVKAAATPQPTTTAATASSGSSGALPFHAVRLLAHAAHAGNKSAQAELDRVCRDGSVASKRFSKETRATPEFKQACADRKAGSATRTAAAN
ncbi:hypothetical protein ABIC89_001402 [Variovorax boronicumulans]|uniref:hypothetical protein n=2 Tax=Variovorax boronicumulans TaxID=436515 RepID=UPI00339A3DD9